MRIWGMNVLNCYENNVKMETNLMILQTSFIFYMQNIMSYFGVKYHLDMFFYRCCEILSRTVGSVGDHMASSFSKH